MMNNSNNRILAFSQNIYKRLLRAYPRAHRTKYGPAMAQLFNDQSRDAWNTARGWGVAKLWLRVLPDLVKSSIIEHLAALNERKSMFDKMAALTRPRTVFISVFTLVFLPILFSSVVITFILPELYASTARILFQQNVDESPDSEFLPYNPYFLQSTFATMESQTILGPVIEKLNLNAIWGRKYNNNIPLKTEMTLQLLKQRLSLSIVPNTKLINITVYSEDKVEAAQIANAIVDSCQNYYAQKPLLQNPHRPLSLVLIIDHAGPGHLPVRPNKPMNIILGTIIGIFLASIAGGISMFIALQLRKRILYING